MKPDGSDPRKIVVEGGGFPLALSPDEKWIYFQHGLNRTLHRVSADGSREEVVWNKPAYYFAVSGDAEKAAFAEKNGEKRVIRIISTADGKTLRTLNPALAEQKILDIVWSPDAKTLYYILCSERNEFYSIWSHPLVADGRHPKKIADLGNGQIFEASNFDISPDGESLIYVQGGWRHDAVWMNGLK